MKTQTQGRPGCAEERISWLQVKVCSTNSSRTLLHYGLGNTPIGSPCGSPTLGRKSLSPMPVNDSSPQSVVRLPRGPPDNATKGFQ